ncbi:MAG: hypothetical protein KJ600_04100 [Nanoarchaeota archaeon]|nr:hypothetical protein [Nanoarchaeota archaeon]MBU1103709.1 hypothetical protein [Nanoarchaeota archaeon]
MAKKKDPEGYYSIAALIGIIVTLVLHYFFLSQLNLHSTLHVTLGVFIFCIVVGALSSLLERVW